MGEQSVVSLVQSLIKMETRHIAYELATTAAHQAANTAKTKSDEIAAAESGSLGLLATLKAVTRNAVEAATGA